MLSDKPEDLDARASKLEEEARQLAAFHPVPNTKASLDATLKFETAGRLRDRAAELRRRRTDGVRFG